MSFSFMTPLRQKMMEKTEEQVLVDINQSVDKNPHGWARPDGPAEMVELATVCFMMLPGGSTVVRDLSTIANWLYEHPEVCDQIQDYLDQMHPWDQE